MQFFYAPDISKDEKYYILGEEESRHCVRVLRLGEGSGLYIVDGRGNLFSVEITDADQRACRVRILDVAGNHEKRDYFLRMAVAPTKNMDRYEWFVEKATEIGVDVITPLLCDRSERRTVKTERLEKIATSAMKQSLKAYNPEIEEMTPFAEFVARPFDGMKFIAHCDDEKGKVLLKDVLRGGENVTVLIGPEGDFSPEEVKLARENGFRAVSLGSARLRTETAAVVTVHSAAFINEKSVADV